MSENYEDNRWATFKQMGEKGWTFKKDEEGNTLGKGKIRTKKVLKINSKSKVNARQDKVFSINRKNDDRTSWKPTFLSGGQNGQKM